MSVLNIVNVGYKSTNYYILADSRPRLLIDAGWPGTLPAFKHECQRKGFQLTDIPHFLCTHYHPDHAGLAAELINAGSKLILLKSQLTAVPEMLKHVKPGDHYTEPDLRKTITLDFDESRAFLAKLGIAGEIVATPGHSDDSVSLVLDQGAAFTGDLTNPLVLPDDPADPVLTSWARLRALGATTIYAGHGPAFQIR